jgi:hypothetical protein
MSTEAWNEYLTGSTCNTPAENKTNLRRRLEERKGKVFLRRGNIKVRITDIGKDGKWMTAGPAGPGKLVWQTQGGAGRRRLPSIMIKHSSRVPWARKRRMMSASGYCKSTWRGTTRWNFTNHRLSSSIYSKSSIKPLMITSELMCQVLQRHSIHPDFLQVVLSFGEEPHVAEAGSSNSAVYSSQNGAPNSCKYPESPFFWRSQTSLRSR